MLENEIDESVDTAEQDESGDLENDVSDLESVGMTLDEYQHIWTEKTPLRNPFSRRLVKAYPTWLKELNPRVVIQPGRRAGLDIFLRGKLIQRCFFNNIREVYVTARDLLPDEVERLRELLTIHTVSPSSTGKTHTFWIKNDADYKLLQEVTRRQMERVDMSHRAAEDEGVDKATREQDPLWVEFQEFKKSAANRFMVRLRRRRVWELKELLRDPEGIDLATFNKEVWNSGQEAYLNGQSVKDQIIGLSNLGKEQLEALETALSDATLELHGNHMWGSGAKIFGAPLHNVDDAQKLEYVRQGVHVLNDDTLAPIEKARKLVEIPGFGDNISTGLVMTFHPEQFAIYNKESTTAISNLGYATNSLEAFEASAHAIKERAGARDFLELDWFLYMRNHADDPTPQRHYWWVNQGATYGEERSAGIIWAPREAKNGRPPFAHWTNMTKMVAGDWIFHYSNGALRAVGRVREAAKEAPKPTGLGGDIWRRDGWLANVEYFDLSAPIALKSIPEELRVAVVGGPFNVKSEINQGYLYPVSQHFAQSMADKFGASLPAEFGQDIPHTSTSLDEPKGEVDENPQPEELGYAEPSFDQIELAVREQGLMIDQRTLRRYHLSLKTRGFVILSGLSGTGKTWLTEVYAGAVGAQYKRVAVAPNWNTNEDLLGYFSPIDKVYVETEFSVFLREAAAEYKHAKEMGHAPKPYHLVLDEMNLARVEYYFAKFLSAMEARGREVGAYMELAPGEEVVLPPNLYFIGTVNNDETTHGFADKIYDRAQLVELNAPRDTIEVQLGDVPYNATVMSIWEAVRDVAPFAFRIVVEITRYVNEADKLGISWQEALDEQLLQKVLPKLKGVDIKLEKALVLVEELTKDLFPLTHARAQRMREGFQQHGFASYF